ncbi:MAG: hypothetical protein JKX94_09355 [Sneathiella sp.]|nr:hypothetical protein [Sneathiella sp.]
MTKQQNEELIDYFLGKIHLGATEELLPLIKEDAEIHICLGNQLYSDSFAATFMGQSGATNFLNICKQFLEFSYITPVDYHHEKNKMIVRGDLKCQMLANGATWTSNWMQIWTMEDGKVTKLRMFADFQPTTMTDHLPGEAERVRITHH